jgi:hypothetical protein
MHRSPTLSVQASALTRMNTTPGLRRRSCASFGSKSQWRRLGRSCLNCLIGGSQQRWRLGGASEAERQLYESAKIEVEQLVEVPISPTDQIFLGKDFGAINLESVNVPVDFKQVIEQRLEEIDKCLEAKAPLATIFLCGSTLEGLIYEVVSKNIESFNRCKAAPKSDGSVKTLNRWTLGDLIEAARELNVVGEDVSKHAMAVRAFRNYIHPRQQMKENFSPRMFTASMAKQVLLAAISDLQKGS